MVVASESKRMFHDRERWRKAKWDRVEWALEEELSLKKMSIMQGRWVKFLCAIIPFCVHQVSRMHACIAQGRYLISKRLCHLCE